MGKRGGTSGLGGSGSSKKERDSEATKEQTYYILGLDSNGKRIPIKVDARGKEIALIRAKNIAKERKLKIYTDTLLPEKEFRERFSKKK